MVVGQIAEPVDVVVVGGGPGGYAAALRLADRGRQVTLIERAAIGGTCLNVGCIPSKTLLEVAAAADLPRRAGGWGVTLTSEVDFPTIQRHIQTVVTDLTGGVSRLLSAAGVDVVSGSAQFNGPERVVVDTPTEARHFTFEHAIVATGSRPVELPFLPFDHDTVLDSTDALALNALPGSLAIVGGGYIGVELATAFAKLGVDVTIIELEPQLLPGMDPRLGQTLARALKQRGVTIHLDASAEVTDDAVFGCRADGVFTAVRADKTIVAVGRRPNSDQSGLDTTGVTIDGRGLIEVDATRRATDRIYAIGDLTAGPALAHKATAEAEVAAASICGESAAFDPAAIPSVVFSDPEVVSVGLTAREAGELGIETRSFRFPFGASARARTLDDTGGSVEMIADEAGTVVGVHMVGPHVSELAGEAALAIEMAATITDLAATIHPHPTMSETLVEAALGLDGRPLHTRKR